MSVPSVKDISLASLLKEKYIQLELREVHKSKIVAELVALVVGSSAVKEKKTLYNAILEREKLGSTAIGGGIALPHAKIDTDKKLTLAFGRSSQGVDFNSLDGEKTYIFFMLISSKKEVGSHLKVLAKISRLTKDKFAVERLRKAESKKEILSALSYLEKTSI